MGREVAHPRRVRLRDKPQGVRPHHRDVQAQDIRTDLREVVQGLPQGHPGRRDGAPLARHVRREELPQAFRRLQGRLLRGGRLLAAEMPSREHGRAWNRGRPVIRHAQGGAKPRVCPLPCTVLVERGRHGWRILRRKPRRPVGAHAVRGAARARRLQAWARRLRQHPRGS